MKCVIPCAGMGTRMGLGIPKVLLEVNGIPILGRIIGQWAGAVDRFVIIASPENEVEIREYLQGVARDTEVVIQKEPEGLADAILQSEPYVKGKFMVNLGDCLFRGKFEEKPFDWGIGVWNSSNHYELRKSYGVDAKDGLVVKVEEKPLNLFGYKCGMGIYFLDSGVFDYIREANVDSGGGDFTGVIQNMIDVGENISPIWFGGNYINITYPEDLKIAEGMIK